MVAIADTLFQWREYALLHSLLQRYQAKRRWSDMLWIVWLKNNYYLNVLKNADNNVVRQFRKNYATFRSNKNLHEHAMFALFILDRKSQFD
jgi:hypothetical protein